MNDRERHAVAADGERLAVATGGDKTPDTPLRRSFLTCAGLIAAVLAIYWQTLRFEFVNFDDDAHVTENVHVVGGLTRDNLTWDFGIHGPSQWHPLAWLSHQADCTCFGLNAGRHHGMNVLLHAAAAVLLFLTLQRMTGAWGACAFVAGAFAVHPLNVESVAWIAERRNVLCAVFWMLTLWAYDAYVRSRTWPRYGAVVVFHAAALMSKPLAATLPCVLMLLDFWPLRRLGAETGWESDRSSRMDRPWAGIVWGATAAKLVLEKVPLLLLSAVAGGLTILCQLAVGTVATLATIALPMRIANAVAAYGWYLEKTLWPTGLACFYPHPALFDSAPWGRIAGRCAVSVIVLAAITVLCVRRLRDQPWMLVGWLWYLGVLVPMIGLVQVSEQQWADRYAYLPIVGLFVMAAWTGRRFAQRSRRVRRGVMLTGWVVLCGWSIAAHRQATIWHDSLTLFTHALEVTDRNHWAHNNLGSALMQRGRRREAVEHFDAAVDAVPSYALGHYNLGVALHDLGFQDAAVAHFETALKNDPAHAATHARLAAGLAETGRLPEAILHFREAVRLLPESGQAHFNLGLALARAGLTQEAVETLRTARELQPNDVSTLLALAYAYRALANLRDARETIETLLDAKPDVAEAHLMLGEILRDVGDVPAARRHFQEACHLRPNWPEGHSALHSLPELP